MRFERRLLGAVVLPLLAGLSEGRQVFASTSQGTLECAITTPNGIAAGEAQGDPSSYGNRQVSVGPFGLWPQGTVAFKPGGAGFVTRDGSLGMKFGWRRGVPGQLTIEGRRLDAPAPPYCERKCPRLWRPRVPGYLRYFPDARMLGSHRPGGRRERYLRDEGCADRRRSGLAERRSIGQGHFR